MPRRFESSASLRDLYFRIAVPHDQPLSLVLTTLSSTPPTVYVSTFGARPTAGSAQWTIPSSQPYQQLTLTPAERNYCSPAASTLLR